MTSRWMNFDRLRKWLVSHARQDGAQTYRLRLLIQWAFALTCALLGVQFARFLHAGQTHALPLPTRPPGVEGFLPISGFMGLLDWIYQGRLNTIHPAATVLFVIFVVIALLARKALCSWICPVGLISESLARIGRRLFGRNFRPPRWLDIPLRGLKYLIAGFFVIAILSETPRQLQGFITSPYNRVTDVLMYRFFAELGLISAVVLLLLGVLSLFIVGAWCRYLCPYGALLGLVSWISPVRIRREATTCIDCSACDKACMARLPVSSKTSIASVECTGCLDCIAVCPAPGTLTVGTRRARLSPLAFAALVLALFLGGYAAARIGDIWHSGISDMEYIEHIQHLNEAEYAHPGS